MDEEENKPGTTIPLMHDMVFDQSLPLRPPKKTTQPRAKLASKAMPGYDPDTIDLFADVLPPEEHLQAVQAAQNENPISPSPTTGGDANESAQPEPELGYELRAELASQLHEILEDLDDNKSS